MTNSYLQVVLANWRAPTGYWGPGTQVLNQLSPTINAWAGQQLIAIKLSGSYAKGTAIRGDADVDIFISMKSKTDGTLKEMYRKLDAFLQACGYATKLQNVSIGITHREYNVDLVPGWMQDPVQGDHVLYVLRRDSHTRTNVDRHIEIVRDSGYSDVIVLMKRWRDCHGLDVPSFVIELASIKALSGSSVTSFEASMLRVLTFLSVSIETAVLMDPANTNNDAADDLSSAAKKDIAKFALASLNAQSWREVVW